MNLDKKCCLLEGRLILEGLLYQEIRKKDGKLDCHDV